MSSLHTALCVTGLLLMLSPGVLGQIVVVAPVNTAGWVGEEGRLNCTINRNNGDHIAWSFLTGTEETTLYSTFKPDEIQPGYEVDYDGQNRVDLILDPITAAKGGRYRCSLLLDTDTRVRAEFVSLDPMKCDSGQGESAVEEGTMVKFICDVTYHSENIQPALQWYNDQGFTLPSFPETDEENPNHIIMTTNITANSDHDMQKFECRLMFDGEGAPTFTSSCDSHVLVNYGARQVELHPEPENDNDVLLLSVGSEINCSARGRPQPNIFWHGEGSETEIIEGNILVMKERFNDGEERTYRCEATNVINGQTRTANRTVRFRVTEGDEGPVTAGTPGWVIAVAIVVPVVVLAAIGAGAFLFIRKRNQGPPPPISSGKADEVDRTDSYNDPNLNTKPAYPENGHPSPYGNVHGGVSVLPPGVVTEQQQRRGRDSPGYADLGIRHFGGSNPGLDDSVDLDPNPTHTTYAQPIRRAPQAPGPQIVGHENRMYDPSPSPHSRHDEPSMLTGGGSVV